MDDFLRRFLTHVLPDRFVRVRHDGLTMARGDYESTETVFVATWFPAEAVRERGTPRKLCVGASSRLLQSLMPHGKQMMHDLLDEIIESAADNDIESIKRSAAEFKNILEGHDRPPTIEQQPAADS